MSASKINELDFVFYPKSIAVAGVSSNTSKTGFKYLQSLKDSGFKGELYAINPAGEEVAGIRTFSSLSSIPGSVEYVIVAIPKRFILDLLDECPAKGVKVLQIFSAGFSETGESENLELERRLIEKARGVGVRIVGPNGIGIYSSSQRMSLPKLMSDEAWETGHASIIGQSGGNTIFTVEMGLMRGVRFSKAVSFGNGNDLDSLDFLEYFGDDSETEIIGAYLEGMKDGQRLLNSAREISRKKPIIIWRGGTTEAGARTTVTHTASLSGSNAVWKAAFAQTGIIYAKSIEELVDTMLAFQCLPLFEGKRIASICGLPGAGGGSSVISCDAFLHDGLEVPVVTDETYSRIKSISPHEGCMLSNPIDVNGILARNPAAIPEVISLAFSDPNIDIVTIHVAVGAIVGFLGAESLDMIVNMLKEAKRTQTKPLVVVTQIGTAETERLAFEQDCAKAKLPTYPTFERAARAIANVADYWEFRKEIEQSN